MTVRKTYRRIGSVIFALVILCVSLGGCAKPTGETAQTTVPSSETTAKPTVPTVATPSVSPEEAEEVTISISEPPTPGSGLPPVTESAMLNIKDTNPAPTGTPEIPAAAKDFGMTKLAFADEFESYDTIDFSGEGKAGYNWYVDRPYGGVTLTKEEIVIEDGVMTFAPKTCPASIGLPTFSAKGKTGYTMNFGYAEARIRFSVDEITLRSEGRNGWPAFWGVSVVDIVGEKWDRVGELDILEAYEVDSEDPHSDVIYTGTLHDHVKLESGKQQIATNLTNATGALGLKDYLDNEWHTYAALWTENYIAWYLDGELMHSVRFSENAYPVYYYRDIEEPLMWNEAMNAALQGHTWVGAHSIMNVDHMVLFLGAHETWPIEVDWVRVWEYEDQ